MALPMSSSLMRLLWASLQNEFMARQVAQALVGMEMADADPDRIYATWYLDGGMAPGLEMVVVESGPQQAASYWWDEET